MGAGVMGSAIAQVFGRNGIRVCLVDRDNACIERAKGLVEQDIKILIENDVYDEAEAQKVRDCLSYAVTEELEIVAPAADIVIECVFEKKEIKQEVFANLDKYCRPDCLFCSNTSSQNIFEYLEISHPERLMIAHWFNPAYLLKLVEVVKGPKTGDAEANAIVEFLKGLGQRPCLLNQYIPGFIVNRMANTICREAGYMITQGWTTAEAIDAAFNAVSGIRYAFEGPLALNDVVGWDLILQGTKDVYASLCNETEESPYAEKLVAEGNLGIKTGKGAFDYGDMTPAEFLSKRSKKILHMYKAAEELDAIKS